MKGSISRIPICILLLVVNYAEQISGATWSYGGHNGPHHWHELFPQACSGKHQSPIDIRPADTQYDPSLNDFAIWYDPPRPGSSLIVTNNGHTAQVVTHGQFYVANGGLPYVYRTTQFHFHWGHAHQHGSEHLIDGHAFPLELHLVSYNSDLYSSMAEAVTEKQGISILGVLFRLSDEDNKDLEPIITAMKHVKDPGLQKQVEIEAMSLRKLLPRDSTRYYRYNGSLTTPGCFESVLWTVFARPSPISRRQLHQFRQLLQPRLHHHHRDNGEQPKNGHIRQRRGSAATKTSSISSSDVIVTIPGGHPRGNGRERRAVHVLEELGLSSQQTERFKRELIRQKRQTDKMLARLDEDNAAKTHKRLMEAVHRKPAAHQHHHHHRNNNSDLSELQVELLQDNLVNNFRPVQPLNQRPVFRSFQVLLPSQKWGSGSSAHAQGGHGSEAGGMATNQNLRGDGSIGGAAASMVSVSGLGHVLVLVTSLLVGAGV